MNGYEFVNGKPVLRPDWDYERIKALADEHEPDSTGMREVTVEVPKGETAWHPGSTKHVLHGPVTIRYEFHRANPGGAVAVRTPEVEQEAIAYLRGKWGDWIKDNPRRPNEILLRA
jgi:hypothetical protein